MPALTFNSLAKVARTSNIQAAQQTLSGARKRLLHESPIRHAIMMPAMSPLMTEGTVKEWKKKEGEAFSAGDVLLQIESDIAMIDVEAQQAGILSKILIPNGTTNVPVEQVIALVAKDPQSDLAQVEPKPQVKSRYGRRPPPPPSHYPHVPKAPSTKRLLTSSIHFDSSNSSLQSSVRRSSPLFDAHPPYPTHPTLSTKALHPVSGMVMNNSRPAGLSAVSSPPIRNSGLHTLQGHLALRSIEEEQHMDGLTLRRIIVSNLARSPTQSSSTFASSINLVPVQSVQYQSVTPGTQQTSATEYFDGLL